LWTERPKRWFLPALYAFAASVPFTVWYWKPLGFATPGGLFPYNTNYREWCRDQDAWENALNYRVTGYAYISTLNTPQGIELAKSVLAGGEVIVKSLTMEVVGPDAQRELLFATKVDDGDLAPGDPWMVQRYIHAEKDVTVAFVRGRVFAFELDRSFFRDRTADWREVPADWGPGDWLPHRLPDDVSTAISGYMAEMGLEYGRLDFLWGGEGYHFLEVNSNGEWAWLDADGSHGLLPAMVEELDPDTERHSIPYPRPIPVRGG